MARKSKEPKAPKIPARVLRIVNYCRAGRVICRTNRSEGAEHSYSIEPGGLPVGEWTFNRALAMGLIQPQGDGLFGESQTYRIADAAAS